MMISMQYSVKQYTYMIRAMLSEIRYSINKKINLLEMG